MVWYIASAMAQSANVNTVEVQRMVDELQPRVEAYLGRPPIGPLQAGVLSREQIRDALAAPVPAVGIPARSSEGRLAADHVRDQVSQDIQVAVYVGQSRGVWVVQEALDQLAAQEGVGAERLRPVLRCLVIHELVHGIQHAYGTIPTDVDSDRLDGWSALREGHATRVELELCSALEGPDIALRVAALHGIDSPGTLSPNAAAAPYAWGRTLVEILDREDPELVWAAISGPPPRWTDIARDIRPILGGGWQDPEPISAALRAEEGAPAVRSSGLQPLGALLGVRGGLGLPLVPAGWIVETPTRVVAAFRTTEPGLPAVIVERRDTLTRGSGGFLLTAGALEGDLEMDRGTVGSLDARTDVARTLRLDLSTTAGAGAYHERWIATRDVLALVVTRSQSGPAGDDEALAALLDRLPSGPLPAPTAADLPSLGGWLEDLRALKGELEPTPGPQWRLLDAAAAWQGGHPAPCGWAFDEVLVPGALRHPQTQAAQAYLCAAAAHETATADRAAALLDTLPPIPAAIHARDLVDFGRLDQALAILDRATPSDARERRTLADARMHVLREARRWDELLALASRPEGSPSMRVQAAMSLRRLGRRTEATLVLASACVAGDGPPPMGCSDR